MPKPYCLCYSGLSNFSQLGFENDCLWAGLGIKSRWGEIFRTCPDWPWGPPSLLYNGYWVFPRGKVAGGVVLTTHPLLAPRLRMSKAIPLLPL
jgi:hypothetical protein